MDTLSHGLWALALFWGTSYRWWAFLIGMIPDLLSFGFYLITQFFHGGLRQGPPPLETIPSWVFTIYDITHSFLTWAIIGIALYFIARRVWPIVFAAGAHIALDIVTHCSYFPTPYLWPLSHKSFCGVGWTNPFVFGLNWLCLAILFTIIGVHEWQKRHKEPKRTKPQQSHRNRTHIKT